MLNLRSFNTISISLPCGVLITALMGCQMLPRSDTPSGPFIVPTSEESVQVAKLAQELDSMATECGASSACDRLQFARALLTLFESREAAKDFFRTLSNSSSPLATSSTLWHQLLENGETRSVNEEQRKAFSQFVRDWIERQFAEYRQEAKRNDPPPADIRADQACVMDSFHKQVRERDRYIAKLRSQLDALKVIDQDTQDRKRKIKPPASLVPTLDQKH